MSFTLTKRDLIENLGSQSIIYGRWDTKFGCWQAQGNIGVYREILPLWPLFQPRGLSRIEFYLPPETQALDEHILLEDSYFSEPLNPENILSLEIETADHRFSPLEEYRNLVPDHIRRLVVGFGDWQWVALDAINRHPNFTEFLISEQKGFGPNFIISCFALANANELDRSERRHLYERIMFEKRTTILSNLADDHVTNSAIKTLRKLSCTEGRKNDFKLFFEIMENNRLKKIIRHSRWLTWPALRIIKQYPSFPWSPGLIEFLSGERRHEIVDRMKEISDLSEICQRPIPRPAITIDQDDTSLDSDCRDDFYAYESLIDCLDHIEHRIAKHAPFPDPPFPATRQLKPLTNLQALAAEGVKMRHCVEKSHAPLVVLGRRYYYHWDGSEKATVSVEKTGKPDGNLLKFGVTPTGQYPKQRQLR